MFEGATPEVVTMEALDPMPTEPRSPRPKPTPFRETQNLKKDKQKKSVPMRESPRKHSTTQNQKRDKQPKRVVDLEAKEGQGTEDINAEGVEPFTKFPEYIPPCNGKEKVTKDSESDKFIISMPMLLEQVPFEGHTLRGSPYGGWNIGTWHTMSGSITQQPKII